MKKLFSLIAFALISMGANAQIFCDASGDIDSGETLIMSNYNDDGQIPLEDLAIYNNTESEQTVTVTVKVNKCPSGDFMCCAGTSCYIIGEGSSHDYTFTIGAGDEVDFKNTEWEPEEENYGTCETEFTLDNGQKIYINFVYADPAGIKEINANANVSANNYNLAGQRVNANAKGLVIYNGKKIIK